MHLNFREQNRFILENRNIQSQKNSIIGYWIYICDDKIN